MSINATLLGQILVFLWIPFTAFISFISFKLGQRKTTNPKATCAVGFLLAFMPPLAIIYVAILALKNETAVNAAN